MVEQPKDRKETAIRLEPYGPEGTYVDLGIAGDPARAERTAQAASALECAFPESEVVRGAGSIALFGPRGAVAPTHNAVARALQMPGAPEKQARTHELEVVYDGPDLDSLSRALRLSPEELVALHSGQEFICELIGFMPGFAYLSANPGPLQVPRRATPRSRVPAGSVALAGGFSSVYPLASPGGWHLIGRYLGPALFDVRRAEPVLFAPGDRARFVPLALGHVPRTGKVVDICISLRPRPLESGLLVLQAPPLTTLQDEGRRRFLARGIPRSGALAPGARRRAERALGNPKGAATLEMVGGQTLLQAVGRVRVALDDGATVALDDGEKIVVPASESWARYLAIEGGFGGEVVYGSRATLIGAGIGSSGGRPLRAGDFLPVSDGSPELSGEHSGREEESEDRSDESAPVLVDPGPHLHHFTSGAFERLLASEYQVSPLSNRVGQRLLGPKVERRSLDTLLPTPMIRGAIEVPASGEPIVLGPDHPTTGGYPVIAVVRSESFDTLGRLRPGQSFRFVHR